MGGEPASPILGPADGWWATLAMTETTSYGVLAYAFGVFLVPTQDDLGWSRTALTGAYAVAVIVLGVMAIPVGRAGPPRPPRPHDRRLHCRGPAGRATPSSCSPPR